VVPKPGEKAEHEMANKRSNILTYITIVITIVVTIGGFGAWLFGQISGLQRDFSEKISSLKTDLSSARTDLSKDIRNTHQDLAKDISNLAQRVAVIEGGLKKVDVARKKQIAELERKIALYQLENTVAYYFPPSKRLVTYIGTVDSIDLIKKFILLRDIGGKKETFKIVENVDSVIYWFGKEKKISLKEIQPGDPVAIRYEKTPTGEKLIEFIGKSQWELN